ncbi:hypothetical protein AAG906_029779 [Vitis piasezkii]
MPPTPRENCRKLPGQYDTASYLKDYLADFDQHFQASETCAADEDGWGDGGGGGGVVGVGGEGSDLLVVHFDDGGVHVVVGVGTAHDTDDREVLAVSAGDGIEDTELADCEGDDASTGAMGPRLAVGGVSCAGLIAAANVFKPRLSDQMVEKSKIKIPENGEDITDTDLHQTASQVTAQSGLRRSDDGGRH